RPANEPRSSSSPPATNVATPSCTNACVAQASTLRSAPATSASRRTSTTRARRSSGRSAPWHEPRSPGGDCLRGHEQRVEDLVRTLDVTLAAGDRESEVSWIERVDSEAAQLAQRGGQLHDAAVVDVLQQDRAAVEDDVAAAQAP